MHDSRILHKNTKLFVFQFLDHPQPVQILEKIRSWQNTCFSDFYFFRFKLLKPCLITPYLVNRLLVVAVVFVF